MMVLWRLLSARQRFGTAIVNPTTEFLTLRQPCGTFADRTVVVELPSLSPSSPQADGSSARVARTTSVRGRACIGLAILPHGGLGLRLLSRWRALERTREGRSVQLNE